MVKVRVVRGVGAAVTGASGLFLLSGTEACTAPIATVDDDVSAAASTRVAAASSATASLDLDYAYGATPGGLAFVATHGTDEFVRVGERLTATVPAYFLWSYTHPDEPVPDDVARAQRLTAAVTVSFRSGGTVTGAMTLGIVSWSGGEVYALRGQTDAFTVPARTDALTFDLVFGDRDDPTKTAHFAEASTAPLYVFGGALPTTHAVFDNEGAAMRTRVVEGGAPREGADVILAYTDWRADTVVDSYALDRQIGTAQSFGRFGSHEMPIYGELSYEVSAGYAFDGAWLNEAPLAGGPSRLVPTPRTAFEATLHAPAGARVLAAYFHVKVFLTANYAGKGPILTRRYADGERVLLKERYDNAGGVPFRNYELPLEARL